MSRQKYFILLSATYVSLAGGFENANAAGPASEWFLTAYGEPRIIYVVRNNSVIRSWNKLGSSGQFDEPAIIVMDDEVRVCGRSGSEFGAQYDLSGGDLGGRYPHPAGVGNIYDGTIDGEYAYAVTWSEGDVYRFDLNWTNPQFLYNVGSSWAFTIAYDVTNDSLWIAGLTTTLVENRSMAGALLSSFNTNHTRNTCLAIDPADNTLWLADNNNYGVYQQYSKAGQLLQTINIPALASVSTYGGEFAFATFSDCNSNGYNDVDELAASTSPDCNTNSKPDDCDIASSTSSDCDSNMVPDECDTDCNGNDVPDDCDLTGSTSGDCNSNGIPDECDTDCNTNGVADECDVSAGSSSDCNDNSVPDECEGPAGPALWAGPDGGAFSDPANWNPAAAPSGGSLVALVNDGGENNRCVLSSAGTTGICTVLIEATGSGRQTLQLNQGSTLLAHVGYSVAPGGDLVLRGGEAAGGPLVNTSDSVTGYGVISTDIENQGLLASYVGGTLRLTGGALQNQATGTLRTPLGSVVHVQSSLVWQWGGIEVQTNGTLAFDSALTNSPGGVITLLDGSLGATTLTNDPGADVTGFGVIQADCTNNGYMSSIADLSIVGNLENNGTITVQSGILTITGNLSGSGAIIGGFGGRNGDPNGLVIHRDFLPSVSDWRQLELTHSTLQLDGDPAGGPQRLEVLAPDHGCGVTLPDATLYSIGTLRIGPSATAARLLDKYENKGVGSRSRRTREAMYVQHLILDPGVTLDLAGLRLYYQTVSPTHPLTADSGVMVKDTVGGGFLRRLDGPRRQDRQ